MFNKETNQETIIVPRHETIWERGNRIVTSRHPNSIKKSYLIEKKHEYRKNMVGVGLLREKGSKEYSEVFYLDFNEAMRITVMGATGSGKTVFMRALMDRCYRSEIIPIICADAKPEYFTSIKPVQRRMQKLLDEDEKPEGVKMAVYYPKIFLKILPNYLEYVNNMKEFGVNPIPITIPFSGLDISTFMTLTAGDFSGPQNDILVGVFKQKLDAENAGKKYTLVEFKKYVNSYDADDKTKRAILNKLQNLTDMDLITEEPTFNHIHDINDGKVIVLSLAAWDLIGAFNHYVAAFISYFVLSTKAAKDRRLLPEKKKIMFMVDEARRFIPEADTKLVTKKTFSEGADLYRYKGISMTFGTQGVSGMDPNIFAQSRYIFVSPKKCDINGIAKIVNEGGIKIYARNKEGERSMNPVLIKNKIRHIVEHTKRKTIHGTREWIVFDKDEGTWFRVALFTPLSYVLEEEGR